VVYAYVCIILAPLHTHNTNTHTNVLASLRRSRQLALVLAGRRRSCFEPGDVGRRGCGVALGALLGWLLHVCSYVCMKSVCVCMSKRTYTLCPLYTHMVPFVHIILSTTHTPPHAGSYQAQSLRIYEGLAAAGERE
jgi:hypothetical protein